jgi:hypothetical protein
MSGYRFGSWPMFNGRKVVLDDDARLGGGVPTTVAGDAVYAPAADTQALAFLPIRVDGQIRLDGVLVMQ